MQQPEFDIAPERRLPAAWLPLIVIFIILISLATWSYFKLASAPDTGFETVRTRIREELLVNAAVGQSESLVKIPDKLIQGKNNTVENAKLYVALQYQQGLKIQPADLQFIARSKKPDDRALAQIYSSPKLDLKSASQLASQLSSENSAELLAKVHAYQKAGDAHPYGRVIPGWRISFFEVAIFLAFSGLGTGIFLWIIYAVYRSSGKLQPLGHPAGILSASQSDRYAIRTFQFLLGYIGISVVRVLVLRAVGMGGDNTLELAMEALLALLVPILALVPIFGIKIPLRSQGWTTENLGKNILWGLAGSCCVAPVYLITAIFSVNLFSNAPNVQHPLLKELENPQTLLATLALAISASVLAPIFEETLFRGTLLPALRSPLKSTAGAIVLSSFLFAMLHPTGMPSWLPLASVGATSALLIYQTKSIIPSIIMHAMFNGIMMVLAMATS